jgi:hypothetical protein
MYPDNEEEQSFLGSVTDTLESAYDTAAEYTGAAYDTVSDVAGQAVDNIENMVDTDHDGAVIDDVLRWGATGYVTVAGAVAGAAIGAAGGPAAAVGGAAVGAAAGYAAGSVVGSASEEYGDFISDALGTRSELPYGDDGCTDLDYKDGRQGSPNPDGGLGHQLNEYLNE